MRRFGAVVAMLVLLVGTCFCAEGSLSATVADVMAESGATVAPTVTPAAPEAVDTGWMHIIGQLSEIAIGVLTPIILLLAGWAAKKFGEKLGIENTKLIESVLDSLAHKAIHWAEAWAEKQADKPSGEQKMQVAMQFMIDMAKKYNLPDIAEEKLIQLIESSLADYKGLLFKTDNED